MSTIWLSRRCLRVVSIEGNEFWFRTVGRILKPQEILNVDLHYKEIEDYHVIEKIPDHYFDFALIDGWNRDKCIHTALRKVKHSGYIYLDNTEQFVDNPQVYTRIPEGMLVSHLNDINEQAKYYVDFSPATFFVSEGLLAHIQ